MPQYSSVTPANAGGAEGVVASNVYQSQDDPRSGQRRNHSSGQDDGSSSQNYPHMTLDGRRRHKHNGSRGPTGNGDDHWQDWTSTWRKIGTKGRSQPVTMTGTVTRGKKKGQVVDVQLDLTDRELMELSTTHDLTPESVPESPGSIPSSGFEPKTKCGCGLNAGPHILLLSILAFPFILIASIFASFYFGALTWQNIFTHFYDERTIWHRIFICPALVLTFPVFIVLFTLGIAIYAAFVQLRWSFLNWKDEVGSLEKGFYGWLCGKLDLEDCSPYTVVELFDSAEVENGHQTERQADLHENGSGDAGARVAVVYTESQDSQGRTVPSMELRRQQRQRNSLPGGGQSHTRMQRVESSL